VGFIDIFFVNIRYQHNKADNYDALPYSYTCLLQFPPKELDSSPQPRLWAFFLSRRFGVGKAVLDFPWMSLAAVDAVS